MTQIPELRGQFTIGSTNDGFNVGASALTLTAGTYYIAGDDTESNGLIDNMQTAIRTIANQSNATVAYSKGTGQVEVVLNTAATLVFTDTPLAAVCGYSSASQASGTSHVGDQFPQHVWRPTRGLSAHPVDVNTFWSPRSSTVVGRSVDGTTYSREGTVTYDATIGFDKLPAADVVTPGTGTVYRDLQQFFEDVACKGSLIRVYPDRGNSTNSDNWEEGLWGDEEEEELGSFESFSNRHISRWQSLWDVEIPLMKKV